MSWFEKLMPSRISTEKRTKSVPEGVWLKCTACDAQLYRNELERNLHVCPKCDFHMRIGARRRLEFFLDPDSIQDLAAEEEAEADFEIAEDVPQLTEVWRFPELEGDLGAAVTGGNDAFAVLRVNPDVLEVVLGTRFKNPALAAVHPGP